jgi:hypothetical protein
VSSASCTQVIPVRSLHSCSNGTDIGRAAFHLSSGRPRPQPTQKRSVAARAVPINVWIKEEVDALNRYSIGSCSGLRPGWDIVLNRRADEQQGHW